MPSAKTITISIPEKMGREIQKVAKEEDRTISELIREAFRQYQAQRSLKKLALSGQEAARARGVTEEDFSGPFEE